VHGAQPGERACDFDDLSNVESVLRAEEIPLGAVRAPERTPPCHREHGKLDRRRRLARGGDTFELASEEPIESR
jgi:hypothetical protein